VHRHDLPDAEEAGGVGGLEGYSDRTTPNDHLPSAFSKRLRIGSQTVVFAAMTNTLLEIATSLPVKIDLLCGMLKQ
jgi:hypothetical protein